MPSNLDKYLEQLPQKDRETLANINAKDTTTKDIGAPTPTPGEKINAEQPKLEEKTAEHIQNVNDGPGNNYEQKGSLAKFPTSQGKADKPKEQAKDNEPEL